MSLTASVTYPFPTTSGREGLYFEVLKQGKIEIYLVDIDLEKAAPLGEYETVDLLWNNKA